MLDCLKALLTLVNDLVQDPLAFSLIDVASTGSVIAGKHLADGAFGVTLRLSLLVRFPPTQDATRKPATSTFTAGTLAVCQHSGL